MLSVYRVYVDCPTGQHVDAIFQAEEDANLYCEALRNVQGKRSEVVEHSVPESFYDLIFLCR